jgi:NADH dehydrogenase
MAQPLVTVFGGTGFLGRHVVRRLRAVETPVRIASRHAPASRPEAVAWLRADIGSDAAVAAAVAGASAVVNAVGLYAEDGAATFQAVHVEAAERLAREAHRAGVERLVHLSGIGADAKSTSRYIRSRGEGERAVAAAFANAIIVRPAVMFGPEDALITTLVGLLQRLPAVPMFGRGRTRLQPVHVEDVAEAITRLLRPELAAAATYELAGPRVYTYSELLAVVAARLARRPALLPMPFPIWHVIARIGEMLPGSPLQRSQVELMEVDTVASGAMPGFDALGISPQSIERTLEAIVAEATAGRRVG